MKIYRLNVKIRGTKRSISLDEDEIFRTKIPTWIPNSEQDLYTVKDYVDNIIQSAPLRTGDWIEKLYLETTDVPDGIDLTSRSNIEIYGADENKDVKWTFEANLVQLVIRQIIEEESIFRSDLYEFAAEITNGKNLFGWYNADPGDLVEEIASELVVMGFRAENDSSEEIDTNDY